MRFHFAEGLTMKTLHACLGLVLLLLAGCGSSHESGRTPSSREVLTAEEISKSGALTAYDAIRIRRPAFLTPQGPKTTGTATRSTMHPAVYLNGMYYGEVESLKDISALNIKDIRYIEAKDATIMYGTGHVAGVIMVSTSMN
jgi:hypothetical protein